MKVAVVGATGAVGREMVEELENLNDLDIDLTLFASPRSAGEAIDFNGKRIIVKAWSLDGAKGNQVVLMSAGGNFSREFGKQVADQGSVVIDNSSAWRMDDEVPLVVPEVNSEAIKGIKSGIIANPNCSTIQMVVPLAAIDKEYGLEMVEVSTYQSVSGSGQKGITELSQQVKDQFNMKDPQPKLYPQPISFNVLSSIGPIDQAGHCEEEEKMVRETRKILSLPKLSVFATTARVPVLSCHCESVLVQCKREVSLEDVQKLFALIPGVIYSADISESESPSPKNVAGWPEIYLSRVRLPLGETKSTRFQFWIVADNLKKGAATNAVQILQEWAKSV